MCVGGGGGEMGVLACVRARARTCECAYACVRVCARACECACGMRACVRVCAGGGGGGEEGAYKAARQRELFDMMYKG